MYNEKNARKYGRNRSRLFTIRNIGGIPITRELTTPFRPDRWENSMEADSLTEVGYSRSIPADLHAGRGENLTKVDS